MHNLCLLNVIGKREDEDALSAYFQSQGIETAGSMLCEGTADKKLLSLLGLEETEKTLLFCMVPRPRVRRLMAGLVSQLGLDMPGGGVAFTIPVGSIAGESSLAALTTGQNIHPEEVNAMSPRFPYELIVAIANRGYAESVMDAARSAGAMGGTVLHAKGTQPANRFFGVSIADEKELLLVLTAAGQKADIMRAVMDEAGVDSPAHTVMFSLPVESVAGLRSVMAAAGENEDFPTQKI